MGLKEKLDYQYKLSRRKTWLKPRRRPWLSHFMDLLARFDVQAVAQPSQQQISYRFFLLAKALPVPTALE
jgi:hypothetical protein